MIECFRFCRIKVILGSIFKHKIKTSVLSYQLSNAKLETIEFNNELHFE